MYYEPLVKALVMSEKMQNINVAFAFRVWFYFSYSLPN